MKIGLVGSAGTGKSTLARQLSNELNVPFLASKEITSDILERDGYDYSSSVQIERFLSHNHRQKEILERTIRQHETDSFVTDRTVFDLVAYAVFELHHVDHKFLRYFYDECYANADTYTHVVLCPWQDKPIGNNQRRTVNSWYQLAIHGIIVGVLERWKVDFHVLQATGEDRLQEALEYLK